MCIKIDTPQKINRFLTQILRWFPRTARSVIMCQFFNTYHPKLENIPQFWQNKPNLKQKATYSYSKTAIKAQN